MYKKIETIEEIQAISLSILIKFDKFCREHNLRYSLAAGTMLGAIRHKGFIPWDDDIDVLMPRPDYDEFIHYHGGICEGLSVINLENMEIPYFAYSKLIDDNTVLIESIRIKNQRGVGIDIFPVDGLPDESDAQKKHFKKLKRYKDVIVLNTIRIEKGSSLVNFILKLLLIPTARIVFNLPAAVKKLDNLARKYDFEKSKYVAAQTLNYQEKEILPREAFENFVEVEFCKKRFMAISCYDKYLGNLFGDYMKLPPLEQRISSHAYIAYYKNIGE